MTTTASADCLDAVKDGEQKGIIEINTQNISGNLSNRVGKIVIEWLELNKEELLENWELARSRRALNRIKPLE